MDGWKVGLRIITVLLMNIIPSTCALCLLTLGFELLKVQINGERSLEVQSCAPKPTRISVGR